MGPNKVPNNLPNDMDVVVVIDKDKLPEDVRKMIEEKLPKDVQEKVLKMLNVRTSPIRDKENKQDNPTQDNIDNKSSDKSKDNRLFAIQTGTVIGNIYDKNFKLEDAK